MAVVTMRELLEAGIHFGHQTRRWHPKMARYIYGSRNGIYIIDLKKTMRQLMRAQELVKNTVAEGGLVLFVGTKKQAQEAIRREAERCGMYYMTHRWLGGTLTNWQTMRASIAKLVHLQELEAENKLDLYSKKEAAMLRKEKEKLERNLSGIRDMARRPDLMFVIDANREDIAIHEARRVGIPCVAVVDTNTDPDEVTLPIPGNDDAIRSINLFCSVIADSVLEGRMEGEKRRDQKKREEDEASREAMARAEKGDDGEEEADEVVAAPAPAPPVTPAPEAPAPAPPAPEASEPTQAPIEEN